MKTILWHYMHMWWVLANLVINSYISDKGLTDHMEHVYNANSLKLNFIITIFHLQEFSKTFFQQLLILLLIYKTFVTHSNVAMCTKNTITCHHHCTIELATHVAMLLCCRYLWLVSVHCTWHACRINSVASMDQWLLMISAPLM